MIPYVLNDSRPLEDVAQDDYNGLGRLADCVSLKITEGMDNTYTAQMDVPIEAYNSGLLHHDGIVKAMDSNGTQLFRINRFAKSLRDGMITCYMNHISYDLNKLACRFAGNVYMSPSSAVTGIYNRACTIIPFDIESQLTTTSGKLALLTPRTVRNAICGEDSILATWGGEVVWDNMSVTLVDQRGEDKTESVIIEYGKNIIDAKQEKEISSIYTGAIGFAFTPDYGTAIVDTYIEQIPSTNPKVLVIDWSDKASKEDDYPNNPLAYVHRWTVDYLENNDISTPKVTMSIDLLSLEKIGAYEDIQNMQKLNLGDTVKVRIKPMDIELTARVIEREYDSLGERTTKVQIGDYVQTLADTLIDMNAKTANEVTYIKTAYAKTATSATNGMMSAEDKATVAQVKPTSIANDSVANASSDWSTTRYSQWTISGDGFIVASVNAYTNYTASYGFLECSIQHSTDGGSTWRYDNYSAFLHEQGIANTNGGVAAACAIPVTNGEQIRMTWRITKEEAKTCHMTILGFGVTGVRTVNGGAI